MIKAPQLLSDLTKLLKRLEVDLLQRIEELPELKESLQAEWQAARAADRCAETFETWVDQVITQAGVHWLLSCVFLRFIEDNGLVERPWLGGTPESGRLALVRDRHEAYFRAHPLENDRDYLLAAFREAGALPGLQTFFDEAHNPVFRLGISGDAAIALRQFWQQVDPNTGALQHDFTDPNWNTRFLGDLYQDLSEATRKRYALLQTPEFVEEFILDRTLTPAIREFGFRDVRMIDPTCGSGHFLLGGFHRVLAEWQRHEPGRNPVDMAQKALNAVAGVDLNPFAIAISRFRLFVAALQASGVQRLANAHDFKVHVAIGDSLLHGTRFGLTHSQELFDVAESHSDTGLAHAYASEDLTEVQGILGRQYHAVVGNPPYIVVKDAALNAAYRKRYASCHRKYSLGAPFTERFFELALTGHEAPDRHPANHTAGFVGLITANSFMKREFGSKLIEQVLPRLDLSHVVDTSGAHIPGHGTPTVILFGRHRAPLCDEVRTVMGIKGEPSTPEDPTQGLVWSAIVRQIDEAGSESEFVSVADTPRPTFAVHPWSIGGGGASDLLETINEAGVKKLSEITSAIGRTTHTGEDGAFFVPKGWASRFGLSMFTVPLVEGEFVRDYAVGNEIETVFPYDRDSAAVISELPEKLRHHFWFYRRLLKNRKDFGNFIEDRGLQWYEHSMFFPDRFRASRGIAFAFVSTHNHFALERGGEVFKQSAPVIKLSSSATEDDYFGVLGCLGSSVACFWCQQVCHNKGGPGGGSSKDEKWHDFYEFSSTSIAEFPLTNNRPIELARRIDSLAKARGQFTPSALVSAASQSGSALSRAELDAAKTRHASLLRQMVATQEELDWHCYHLYGLIDSALEIDAPPEVNLGERAFEIVLARRLVAGSLQTRWFEWLGIEPVVEIPTNWPARYRELVERRIALIESDRFVGLVEAPGCKRRWESPPWESLEQDALRVWLLDRLETPGYWPRLGDNSNDETPQLMSTARLADAACRDFEFMQIAELYAGHADFDLPQLVAELVASECVPALPVQRYTDTGLRKRAQWQDTWALQRREDAIDAQVVADNADTWRQSLSSDARVRFRLAPDAPLHDEATAWVEEQLAAEIKHHQEERKANEVGTLPVPPKYQSKDFLKSDFWRLRGGLDVPKERWISFPGCERGADGSLVIAWAGWNHLQQATAVAGYYMDMKDSEGWEAARLQPLLAALLELVPWLEQWHNEMDPVFGERMGHYYKGFVTEEARALGFTLDDLRAWKPAPTAAKRGRKKKDAT